MGQGEKSENPDQPAKIPDELKRMVQDAFREIEDAKSKLHSRIKNLADSEMERAHQELDLKIRKLKEYLDAQTFKAPPPPPK